MSQTQDHHCCTDSEVSADWHKLMVLQCVMRTSIAHANRPYRTCWPPPQPATLGPQSANHTRYHHTELTWADRKSANGSRSLAIALGWTSALSADMCTVYMMMFAVNMTICLVVKPTYCKLSVCSVDPLLSGFTTCHIFHLLRDLSPASRRSLQTSCQLIVC